MGMAMEVFAVSDPTLKRLLADPPLVWQLIAPEEPAMYEEARAAHVRKSGGFLSRLLGRTASEPVVQSLELAPGEGLVADLDKAWHGLHYLFTGSDGAGVAPMDFLVVGGDPIGDVDVGYGPARAIAPPIVAEIARTLAALTDIELSSRVNPADMAARKIYPDIWGREPGGDDVKGYLLENLSHLRKGVADAVGRGHGLILVLH